MKNHTNSTLIQQTTPLLTGDNVSEKREEIKRYFINSWQTYESLFSLIQEDSAYFLRPEPLRHPLIFYFGHTATFYINKLILGKYINERLNEKLEAICAVGVDEMSWDDLDSRHYDWPKVEEVRSYRKQVFELICGLIDTMPLTLPITQDSLAWVVLMGCEHERIHLETSSVIMRMLPLSCLKQDSAWQACPDTDGETPMNGLVTVKGKQLTLGKTDNEVTYGWDNEYGQLDVEVADFKASQFIVSNGEYLTFIQDGGYQTPEYWTEEGQNWLAYSQAKMPRFWVERNNRYFQRNLTNETALPLSWPVEVNYLEAKAFCNWRSQKEGVYCRLLTEAEWYRMRENLAGEVHDWQEIPVNTNLAFYASSCPVNRFESNGLFDIAGNVWQWTESAIDGYNGFKVHPLYDDFSTPTFDGKHNLIKGGSWISTGNETIKASRYAFRRHFFQHAGFRYIESTNKEVPVVEVNRYETEIDVCQQLYGHYAQLDKENFSVLLANYTKNVLATKSQETNKLLHLGCSVGRTSFDLSQAFAHVDAVDFTARFIQYGVNLQQGKAVKFQNVEQGEIVNYHEFSLSELANVTTETVKFSQGDAVNLKPIFDDYDVILVQQTLEQSYDPKQALQTIKQRLKPNGLLVLASSFVFDETTTPKDKWLGGVKVNGENQTGIEAVANSLGQAFKLLATDTLPKKTKLNQVQSIHENISVSVWQKSND